MTWIIAVRPFFSLAYGCIMQRRNAYSGCCTCRRSWYETQKASVLTSWLLSPPVMPGQGHLWGGVIIIIFPSRTVLRLPLFYIFVISFGIPGQPSRTLETTAMCAQSGASEKQAETDWGITLRQARALLDSTMLAALPGCTSRAHGHKLEAKRSHDIILLERILPARLVTCSHGLFCVFTTSSNPCVLS